MSTVCAACLAVGADGKVTLLHGGPKEALALVNSRIEWKVEGKADIGFLHLGIFSTVTTSQDHPIIVE